MQAVAKPMKNNWTSSHSKAANAPETAADIEQVMNGGNAIGGIRRAAVTASTKVLPSLQLAVDMRACEFMIEAGYQGGLRKWFRQKWVNIGRKKDGKHPECGTSVEKSGYAKCVPAAKARSLSAAENKSAVSRKRRAQSAAGRPGKSSGGSGRAPVRVSTAPQK